MPQRQSSDRQREITREYTTPQAAKELGISSEQFRRLTKNRGIQPTGTYKNPHYKSGPECPLWSRRDIGCLKRTNDLKKMQMRTKADPELAQAKRMSRFSKRYADFGDVLADACKAMLSLNRYAKWRTCKREHKDTIYDLKNRLLRVLYELGIVDRVYLHIRTLPAKQCRRCKGTGQDDWCGYECERCDGTGIYEDARDLHYVVFSLPVGDKRYTWHQPVEIIGWNYVLTAATEHWHEAENEKPLEMAKSKFADAKDLIRFALQLATGTTIETAETTGSGYKR